MKLSFDIAKRYLLAKKSHNAINIVSMISWCGVAVATMALVCTMSVFNGFHDFVEQMFTSFDPELKISAVEGKSFSLNDTPIRSLEKMESLEVICPCIEDNVLIEYNDRMVVALIKGVDFSFMKLTKIAPVVIDGTFRLQDSLVNYGNMGAGLAYNLSITPAFVYPFKVVAPLKGRPISLSNPATSFRSESLYLASVFSVGQPQIDDQTLITPYHVAADLLGYDREATSLSLKVKQGYDVDKIQKQLSHQLAPTYKVENRYEQQRDVFRMMEVEKWVTFLILAFILLIAAFNIIGSLTLLIHEKESDATTLYYLGADQQLINRIFLLEGWLISGVGSLVGIALGVILCLIQQYFGIIKMGQSFMMDAYPVRVAPTDLLFILIIVLLLGFVTAWYPVYNRKKKIDQLHKKS